MEISYRLQHVTNQSGTSKWKQDSRIAVLGTESPREVPKGPNRKEFMENFGREEEGR